MQSKKDKVAGNNNGMNGLLSVGAWNNLPHYAVHGTQTDFYLWHRSSKDDRGNCTVWISGKEAFDLHDKLRQARTQSKEAFVDLFLQEYHKRKKTY